MDLPVVSHGAMGAGIIAQEEALDVLGQAMGCRGRPQLPEALRWLRAAGVEGRALAARLQRQSRMRNAAAHPDVGLSHHIAEFVLEGGTTGHLVERVGFEDVAEQERGVTEGGSTDGVLMGEVKQCAEVSDAMGAMNGVGQMARPELFDFFEEQEGEALERRVTGLEERLAAVEAMLM